MVDNYSFKQDPAADLYGTLLHYAISRCSTFSLAVRHSIPMSAECEALLQALSRYEITRTEAQSWPGTKLIGHCASLVVFDYCRESASILIQATEGLFQWLQPDFPEDLCLYRPDGSVWLTSIAHEKDGYLSLAKDELDEMRTSAIEIYQQLVV